MKSQSPEHLRAALSEMDRRILAPLLDGPREVIQKGEQCLEDLCKRGYVRLSLARRGPLGGSP